MIPSLKISGRRRSRFDRFACDSAPRRRLAAGDDWPLLSVNENTGDSDNEGRLEPQAAAPNVAWFFGGFWYVYNAGDFAVYSPDEAGASMRANRREAKRWGRRLGRLLASLRGDQDLAGFAAFCGRAPDEIARVESGAMLAAVQLADCLQSAYGGPFIFEPRHGAAVDDSTKAQGMGREFHEARLQAGLGLEAASVLAGVLVRDLLAIESGRLLCDFPIVQDVMAACRSRIPADRQTSEAARLRDFVLGACSD